MIHKDAGSDTTTQFPFAVSPIPIGEPGSYTITGTGQTNPIGVAVGSGTETVTETVPADWNLTAASCVLSDGTTATGTKSGNAVNSITIESGKTTTCNFTDRPAAGSLKITKTVDAGGSSFTSGSFGVHAACTNPANTYDQTIAYPTPGNVTIPGIPAGSSCTVTETSKPAPPAQYSWATESITGNPATIPSGGTANVTVANTLSLIPNPQLGLTKTDDLNPSTYDHVGQLVTYTLTATNNGNVTLHLVSVSDTPALGSFSCKVGGVAVTLPVASLAPGASVVCTGTHAITQADLDAGSFLDTGHASSTEVAAPDAPDTITASQNPHLAITKAATQTSYANVGDVINYTIVATNDGNVTLPSVTVTDANAINLVCTPANGSPLAPTAKMNCTASHTIVQADLDAGHYLNTACVDDGPGGAAQQCASKDVPKLTATGQITPTATTCQQFASGTASDLNDLFYNLKGGKINSISPGVLFYYSKITAPASSFTIEVRQSDVLGWKKLGTMQLVLYDANCNKTSVSGTYSSTTGTVTFKPTALTAGAIYYIGVKYDPGTLVGQQVPGNKPTDKYTLVTYINGGQIVTSLDSINVKGK